jgi:effector-binding domain-containing protein
MKRKLLYLTMATIIFASCGEKKEEAKKEEPKEEDSTVVEETPAYEYTYEVTETEVPAGWMVTITNENITMDKVKELLGANFGSISAMLSKSKKEMGAPLAIYHNWVDPASPFTMQAGFSVMDSTIKVKAPMVLGKSYVGKAIKTTYMGDYQKIKAAYDDLMQYSTEKGLNPNGSPWEVYIVSPMMEKDTMKWQTDIYIPVK